MHWVSRSLPKGVRHVARRCGRAPRARAPTSSTRPACSAAASLGAALARTPFVVKLTADPAFERARRRGHRRRRRSTSSSAARRRRGARAPRSRAIAELRRAAHVFTPERVPARARARLGRRRRTRVRCCRTRRRRCPSCAPRDELRAQLRPRRPDARLRRPADRAEVAATSRSRRSRASTASRSLIAGDGRRARRARARVAELGSAAASASSARSRASACSSSSRAADASLLSSSWENFPHTVVEALAVGTPVIATATGGVAEVVDDGENGLLVPPGDAGALAAAIRRFFGDDELRGAAARGRGRVGRARTRRSASSRGSRRRSLRDALRR